MATAFLLVPIWPSREAKAWPNAALDGVIHAHPVSEECRVIVRVEIARLAKIASVANMMRGVKRGVRVAPAASPHGSLDVEHDESSGDGILP